jgi:hypothetical protein
MWHLYTIIDESFLNIPNSISTKIAKVIIEKVHISILVTNFSMHTSTDSLFYLNIIFCWKECERKRERERVKDGK